ncbi:MAG: GNAT family N-acetyltransferase [Methanomethylovorans sp.]|nr:GNAT family N-acetyltransferase [Methanomethylovorans sp.]
MTINVFSLLMNSSVKDFVINVLASEGFAYDLKKDLDLDDISANYLQEGSTFYVAFSEGRIIGTCAVKKRSIEKCEIKRLYVHKDYRRRGIGYLLLKKALQFSEKQFTTVILKTDVSLTQAIELYLRAGFCIVKEEDRILYLEKNLHQED